MPFSELKTGVAPEAIRCHPVWEKEARSPSNQPQSEDDFYPQWIGRNLILFRAENKSGFFFLLDTGSRTISLFHDGQWKRIPIDQIAVANDIWQYYDPAMKVKLSGFEEKTGQIFFYVEHKWTTLFEYNPLWPYSVTVLLDNLPAQVSAFTNYIGGGKLSQRNDGTVWFCVETGGEAEQFGLVFQYNTKSKILTPVFNYSDEQNCYFYKDSIAIHKWPEISLFDYNTGFIYPLEDCSEMYVTSEIGPTMKECIKTYSEKEKRHYLWDVAANKRYYVTYDDMVVNFPGADHMTEGDKIVYLHGSGCFYLEQAGDDNRLLYDGYSIDWYSTIRPELSER